MDDLKERFERDGYVVVADIIGAKTVQDLRAFFLPIFEGQKINVLHDAVLHYRKVFEVLSTPRLVEALAALLGDDFLVPPYTSVELNRFGVFHTDTTGAEISGQTFHKERDFRIVTVGIYLQDNNEYGGGIRLVPGSHRESDPYVELTRRKADVRRRVSRSRLRRLAKRLSGGRLYDWNRPFLEHDRGTDVRSKAGDAIIWDLRITHRASPKVAKSVAPDGGKVSMFFNCAANNRVTTEEYLKYVVSIRENEFLRRERPLPTWTGADAGRKIVIL
jgi:ectoine hydroxylase-related dioxygenase (phytanoyl-CoA dioxygenase family)